MLRRLRRRTWRRRGRFDTNPPPPLSMPVVSATEFLGHVFKRLQIRVITRSLPPGARLIGEYLDDGDEGFQ
jgi:hypothetical protein